MMKGNVTIYNKLVRDKIPEKCRASGVSPTTHVATAEEYRSKLADKLVEEAVEFKDAQTVEELADALEVLLAICKERGWSLEEVERVRREKTEKRGGFDQRIILEKTEE